MEENKNLENLENNENRENKEKQVENTEKKTAADLILERLQNRKENNSEKSENLEKLRELQEVVKNEAVKDEQEETEEEEEQVKKQMPNYKEFTREQMVARFEELLAQPIEDVKKELDILCDNYYTRRNAEIIEKRDEFVKNGGKKEEFVVEEDETEKKFKELYEKFKSAKQEYNQRKQAEEERNAEIKQRIIDNIEGLIEKGETLKKTFDELHQLQDEWRNTGSVPQKLEKQLNDKYYFTLQKFYDWVKINKELRDMDLQRNLELKTKICEEAEALLIEPKITVAYKKLQKLQKRWSEIGPVPREHKEAIWQRFRETVSIINKRHYDYFQNLKKQQQDNLKAKELLCEEAEKIADGEYKTSSEWRKKTEEMNELMTLWRLIGFAPKKYNNQIFERFITARKKFFERKNEFFQNLGEELEKNLELKKELIAKAEEIKESTDWGKATKICIDLQNKWKDIGPVPNAVKDEIWEQFKNACNYFFDRKREYYATRKERELENLKKKEELIEKIKNYKPSDDPEENLKALQQFKSEWTEIGFVPIKEKDRVNKEYRNAISELLKLLDLDDEKQREIELKHKIENILASNDPKYRLKQEIERTKNRIDKIHNEVVTLENNMRFFIKSKNSEEILKNFENKIEKLKKQEDFLNKTLVEYFKALKSLQK